MNQNDVNLQIDTPIEQGIPVQQMNNQQPMPTSMGMVQSHGLSVHGQQQLVGGFNVERCFAPAVSILETQGFKCGDFLFGDICCPVLCHPLTIYFPFGIFYPSFCWTPKPTEEYKQILQRDYPEGVEQEFQPDLDAMACCCAPCKVMSHDEGKLSTQCTVNTCLCLYAGFCWQPKHRQPGSFDLDPNYPKERVLGMTEAEKRLAQGITCERCCTGSYVVMQAQGCTNVQDIVLASLCCCLFTQLAWTPKPTKSYVARVNREYPHECEHYAEEKKAQFNICEMWCCAVCTVGGHDKDWVTFLNASIGGCFYTYMCWVPKQNISGTDKIQ